MDTPEPLLRTLAPLLRNLEADVRRWLDTPHRYPLPMIQRASLEGLVGDLRRQADALDVERPTLLIALMGGTGVGKSTLLNALAGSPIAQASFTRPTTRDPVVYFHESIRPDKLDPVLRHCRLAQHDRISLAQKIIVDTPDIDSNDLANREKLFQILPAADIVLYVGSQEKYHDRLGWELFKDQRKRRAFAFVLNKWDRCLHAGAAGLRPDEDLLKDLEAEGFEKPLLFRTVAQAWVDHGDKPGRPPDLPEGEQFQELRNWLEMGLTRLEIEAVKVRGTGQLLTHLGEGLQAVRPPDLKNEAARTRTSWERLLNEEASIYGDVLLSTLDPYQSEIEHHFNVQNQQKFRGFMAAYLRLTTRVRYAGNVLKDRIPFKVPNVGGPKVETPSQWDLADFAHQCTRAAGEKVLDRRGSALVNRLLVEADSQRFPVSLLTSPTTDASRLDWNQSYDRAMMEALAEAERVFTRPTGFRRFLQGSLSFLANTLPEVAFVSACIVLLYAYFMEQQIPSLVGLASPVLITGVVLVLVQALMSLLLPLRWSAVRGEFHRQLLDRLKTSLESVYAAIPEDVARELQEEQKLADILIGNVSEVSKWLEDRENAASISGLYGK